MPPRKKANKVEDDIIVNDFPLTLDNIELNELMSMLRNSQYRNIIKQILEQEKKDKQLIVNVSLV